MARQKAIRAAAEQRDPTVLLLVWALVMSVLMLSVPAFSQAPVPEVIKPRSDAPTLPPSSNGTATPQPRSENPLTQNGTRPIPDSGVIAPPPSLGQTPVIKPPAESNTPVIPPPGTSGGDKVVPR